jgi:hypothetical protein
MADIFTFQPTEFEVLETFDFEEEIQRPDETRFYTLDEQLIDFFDKMMPKRKVTKFEIKELKQLRDRVREAYQNIVVVTESDYIIDNRRKLVNTDWIHPVYAGFEYSTYSYAKQWEPLFTQRRTVNYYSKLLNALPRPYTSIVDGRPLERTSMLVNEEGKLPVNGLGNYLMTKTIVNDDGTVDVITVEAPNTADDIKTSGYYLDARPFEIPRPMMEHPFLKSNQANFVKTEMSLVDAYPSISAIMEHAIPVTTDPYILGKKYAKLYDIKLSQIPWSSWKERFPPVEYVDVTRPSQEIPFQQMKQDKPGDILTKTYLVPWNPAYSSRLWLSNQVDGGHFISRILLSEANVSGNLASYAFSPSSEYDFPEVQPESCSNLMSEFNTFLDTGVYRVKKKAVKDSVVFLGGQCIPVSTLLQEKAAAAYDNRVAWKETTRNDILVEYQKLLKSFQAYRPSVDIEKYARVEHRIQSERRRDVIVIMEDPEREPEDKADALEKIIRDMTLDNRQYFDVPGQFVLCSHTLEILRNAMDDRYKFYAEWTVSIDGARVCRFCGEEVNKDSFVAVKEYDEDGHLTMDYSALDAEYTAQVKAVNTLSEMKKLIDINNAGESLLFTTLSLLQVTPDEQQLMSVLQLIRKLTGALKGRAASSKTISKDNQELVEGVLGIAGVIVLLQTHTPFLIPKRGIGTRPLNTTGYPRDSDNPEECHVLTSILIVLKRSFESFPGSFKGSIATVLRAILKNSADLKVEALRWIKIFSEQFKPLFDNARERYEAPTELAPQNLIQLPIEHIDDPRFSPGETLEQESYNECKSNRTSTSWSTKRLPNVRQTEAKLQPRIDPSPDATSINSVHSVVSPNNISDNDIRRRIGLGLPPGFPALAEFMKVADGASYVAMMSRCLGILSFTQKDRIKFQELITFIDSSETSSRVRDIAKGVFFEFMATIKASPPLTRTFNDSIKKDLTLRMILLSEDAAKKEDFELRAKERNFLKAALRSMTDIEREVTQKLLELGIADIIISNVDRERFAREFSLMEPDFDEETNAIDMNRPEEGYDDTRDYVENGDQPIADDGTQLEVDRGFYGDRAVRDYDDYTTQSGFDNNDDL